MKNLLIVLGFLTWFQLQASEVSKFYSCYQIITREPLSPSDPLLAQVQSNSITAAQACLNLLSESALDPNSHEINKVAGQYPERSLKIIKNFNDFHRTWFSAFAEVKNNDCYRHTVEVHDNGEMAYYLTRALFESGTDFKSIVTSNKSLEAIRYSLSPRENRSVITQETLDFKKGVMGATQTWAPPLLPLGKLVGIQEKSPFMGSGFVDYQNLMSSPFDIFENKGGGMLGSVPYLLLNFGRNEYELTNGGRVLPRRWAKAFAKDILCRDLPLLRPSDAAPLVKSNSSLPFKKATSCMQCHAFMDPVSKVLRNSHMVRSTDDCMGPISTAHFHTVTPNFPAETYDADSDYNFFRRPSNGKLFMRSFDGSLIDLPLTSVQDLGDKLANMDDMYVCAANRYFYFFTGLMTDLIDAGLIKTSTSNSKDLALRNYIINLGKNLKNHQDTKELIKQIINSPYFADPLKEME